MCIIVKLIVAWELKRKKKKKKKKKKKNMAYEMGQILISVFISESCLTFVTS